MNYKATMQTRPPKARSKRIRQAGVSAQIISSSISLTGGVIAGGGQGFVTGDGHTHANLSHLNRITTDADGYQYLETDVTLTDPATGEGTTEKQPVKVRAGRADTADVADDLSDESPAWQKILRKDIADEAREVITFLKGLLTTHARSADFLSGELGTGFTLEEDPQTGTSYLEVDKMLVRRTATFIELVIKQLRHVGGSIILSAASMECIRVEETADGYRCYFRQDDGGRSVAQEFQVWDQARAQSFNIEEGVHENVSNTYYWRLVQAVGTDWIELSKTDCDTGSGVPHEGDHIVLLGNRKDPARQNAIVLSSVGEDAPSIKQYKGINSYSLTDDMAVTILSPKGNLLRGSFVSEATGERVDDMLSRMQERIDVVREQTDKEYTLWFYDNAPTTENAPAADWTTDELRGMHAEDMYYDRTAGRAYRWTRTDGGYAWEEITDQETVRALEKAGRAQDTADSKRRVFVSQPSDSQAYDPGDQWVNATFGQLYSNDSLVCITGKSAGAAFSINHWRPSSTATTAYIVNMGNEIRTLVADNKTAGDKATAAAKAAADAAQKAADAAQQTANGNKESITANATAIAQNATSISALSGKFTFDKDGNVTNVNQSGVVLTSNYATLFTEQMDANTLVKRAEIASMVTKDADGNIVSGVKISADQITMNGNVVFATTANVATAKSEAISSAATDAQNRVNTLKNTLGNLAYKSMVGKALLDTTVISGGYILSSLINVDTVLANKIGAASITTSNIAITEGARVGSMSISKYGGLIGSSLMAESIPVLSDVTSSNVSTYLRNNIKYARTFILGFGLDAGTYTMYLPTHSDLETATGVKYFAYTVEVRIICLAKKTNTYYGTGGISVAISTENDCTYRITPSSSDTLYTENAGAHNYIDMQKGDTLTLIGVPEGPTKMGWYKMSRMN